MSTRLILVAIAGAAAAGCYLSNGDASGGGGTTPNGNNNSGPTTTSTDLPCDVAQVLSNCTSCHSSPPTGGAPMALVSYADLTAPAPTDATKTAAQMCVTRMQSTTAPMPPGGGASQTDVATLQSWISAGYPQGSCSGTNTNYNTPLTCTSGTYNNASEGQGMRPGGACNSCHSSQYGEQPPIFSIAGTVYPTAHEYDKCVGVSGMQVVIMDENGNTQLTLTTNSSGNFTSQASIKKPYRAKIVSNGNVREMSATQTNGDCNSCHTESGANGAPGRIMQP